MSNLTVGLVVPMFPNIVQPYVLNQIIALQNAGINVQVIASKRGTDDELHPAMGELPLQTSPIYINTTPRSILQNSFSRSTLRRKYLSTLRTILSRSSLKKDGIKHITKKAIYAKALTQQHLDIIHSHSLFSSYNYLFLREDFSIPLITTYHGSLPPGVPRLDDEKMQKVFDKGDMFLVNTSAAKKDLAKLGCPPSKIRIIPQGINLHNFSYHERTLKPDNTIILLSVGRLSFEKGHRTVIEALAELVKVFPTVEYHIVGDGPEKKALLKLTTKLGLTGNVVLHGFKTPEELGFFYATSHILILPSLEETQGTVLQEAQASGIPVIGSRAGGIPEVVIENDTGLLFNTSDPVDLASKIRNLILSPELYKKLIASGRKDVEKRFDIKALTSQLVSEYEDILNKGR